MKKVLCVVIALILVFAMSTSAFATGAGKARLSEMTDEECIAFLKESGVEIPPIFEEEIMWAVFVRNKIEEVEANPNVSFLYNYSVLNRFANDIKIAVNTYYGITETNVNTRSIADLLQDSMPWGDWSDDYLNYNAYGYVLGVNEWVDPGVFDWVSKGNIATSYIYNASANVYTIASWIAADLEALSYTVNSVTTAMPSTTVTAHTSLICVRIDTTGEDWYEDANGDMVQYHEYHLMKLTQNGVWLHKPYYTMPLRYNHTPSYGRVWLSEGCLGEEKEAVSKAGVAYNSNIYFIKYTTPHKWAYVYCGSNQHILTCTICGATSGTAHNCIYVNNFCKSCGNYNGSIHITPNKRPGAAVAVTE